MKKNKQRLLNACLLLVFLASLSQAFAGGPLILFVPGTPFRYPGPLVLFTDNDPMFSTTAPITNAMADATAAAAIAEWTAVPTATFVGTVGGDFTSIGLPDITLANVFTVLGAFNGGGYHIIYDHNGTITAALAGPGVLGFSGPEFAIGPDLIESVAVLNGASVSATDVTLSAWSGVFTHEFGHGINLAHSQTNGAAVFFGDDIGPSGCPTGGLPYGGAPTFADLETMYPFIDPSPPVTSGPDQFTVDQLDDISALSNVYPVVGWPSTFGTITGTIFLPNGTTPIGGVNVIARNVADPFGDAISALSGDFTQTSLDGLYTFNGLTPGASYVVYVDQIVAGGFSQPPISLLGDEEFFNGASESSDPTTDDPCAFTTISAVAGTPFTANVIFNSSFVGPITNAEPGVCYGTTGIGGTNPGSLFTIDIATGAATLVGPTGQARMPSVAINSKGEMFGSNGGGASFLFRIDAATGLAGVVEPITFGAGILAFIDAIAFDAKDVLYGIDFNNDLYTINPVTGAATLVGFTGVTPLPFLVGMAFDPGTRRLFASTGGIGGFEDIYEINPATAAATLIGSTGLGGVAIPGLHFANGKLFGSENIGGTFNLISINSSTGAGAVVGPFGAGLRMSGLASFILPHVLLADENVEIDRQVNSDGDIHANHSIIFKEGNRPNSTHTGDLTAGDNIIIGKRNRIVGAAMADNDVDNQGAVTGGVTEHVNVTRFPLEDMPGILHGVNNIIVGENKSRTLAPGNYNQIKVAKHGTLRLSSGVYNISSLEMSENSLLLINLSSGNPISINADDRVKLLKKVNMKLVPATASTVLITFNVDEDDTDGDDKVLIGDESRAFGTFNVPEGTVELGMKARLKGAVFAENIRVKMGARFVHHSSAAKFPKESDESEVDESEVVADNVITDYVLEQNYPNPFNPSTKIKFDLPEAGTVELQIYDLVGNLVKTLVSAPHSAGHHEASWNGRNSAGKPVAGGVYLYRIKVERANGAAPMVITKKMTFLK